MCLLSWTSRVKPNLTVYENKSPLAVYDDQLPVAGMENVAFLFPPIPIKPFPFQ